MSARKPSGFVTEIERMEGKNQNPVESPWMDARAAALYLGRRSKNAFHTINRLAKERRIKAGHDGKRWLFKAESLDAFLEATAKKQRP